MSKDTETAKLTLRIPRALHSALVEAAAKDERSLSVFIARALRAATEAAPVRQMTAMEAEKAALLPRPTPRL